MVPQQIIKRVVTAYHRVQNQLGPTKNPVQKAPLVVCDHDVQLIIEELFDNDRENPAHDESNSSATSEELNGRNSRHSSKMQAVFTQLKLI